jgi:hypothetical protein
MNEMPKGVDVGVGNKFMNTPILREKENLTDGSEDGMPEREKPFGQSKLLVLMDFGISYTTTPKSSKEFH